MENAADLSLEEARVLVSARIRELGAPAAAKQYGCSLQMVHLVLGGKRRPSESMLEDVGLEAVTPPPVEIRYRRKATTGG